jgi:hypothetical protein
MAKKGWSLDYIGEDTDIAGVIHLNFEKRHEEKPSLPLC